MTRRFSAFAVIPFAVLAALPAAVRAQSAIEVGNLTCTGGEGVGMILGSQKSFSCTFAGTGGVRETYSATVTKIGLDIGVTGQTVMVWTVLAATQDLQPGVLAGNYAGASADASVGIGGGANILVGGSQQAITLQPVSVQGQTGLNLAVGVAGMVLR